MGAEEKGWNPVAAMEEIREVGRGAPEERRKEKEKEKDGVPSIPSSTKEIDISLPFAEMKPSIIDLCKDLFRKWSSLDNSCFSIETVSGGITNLLLKVSVKEESGNDVSLTVRLYGPNTDLVIDRKRELQAIPYLSAAGFGAKLLGIFKNGIIQSFINARTLSPSVQLGCVAHGSPPLLCQVMAKTLCTIWNDIFILSIFYISDMSNPKIAAEIAKQLYKFHQVDIPGSREAQLWNDVFKFLEKAAVLQFDDNEKQAKYETISFKEICNEINALKELTDLLNAPVVFAHNDLLSGNLMLNDEEGKLYFIDFEYGSYSYRGYDIANHFNEYAGFDCDYNLYPEKNVQCHFFQNYLRPDRPHEVPDKDLEALYIETNTFRLASHIYWALWALIQAKVSPIDFDYLCYFFLRYNEYKKEKEACFFLAQKYLSGSRV